LRIRLTDSEPIFIEMGLFIRDTGNRIYKMGREWRLGLMEASTRENIKMAKSTAREYTYGQTVAITQAHGMKIKYTDTVNIFG
jgi:hypothetical protein